MAIPAASFMVINKWRQTKQRTDIILFPYNSIQLFENVCKEKTVFWHNDNRTFIICSSNGGKNPDIKQVEDVMKRCTLVFSIKYQPLLACCPLSYFGRDYGFFRTAGKDPLYSFPLFSQPQSSRKRSVLLVNGIEGFSEFLKLDIPAVFPAAFAECNLFPSLKPRFDFLTKFIKQGIG